MPLILSSQPAKAVVHWPQVYLVGTAHVSQQSQQDVLDTIAKVNPAVVVLELDKASWWWHGGALPWGAAFFNGATHVLLFR